MTQASNEVSRCQQLFPTKNRRFNFRQDDFHWNQYQNKTLADLIWGRGMCGFCELLLYVERFGLTTRVDDHSGATSYTLDKKNLEAIFQQWLQRGSLMEGSSSSWGCNRNSKAHMPTTALSRENSGTKVHMPGWMISLLSESRLLSGSCLFVWRTHCSRNVPSTCLGRGLS